MGSNVVTVIQYTANGTSVVQGKADDPGVVEAIASGGQPGVTVEVIEDVPAGATHPAAGFVDAPEPPAAKTEPEPEAAPDPAPDPPRREARANVGPVGPDPDQEAAKAVPAPKPARKRG